MPLKKGKKNVSRNIRELHKGKTYARTKAKRGKAKADKQAVAIAMREAGMPKKKLAKHNRGKMDMSNPMGMPMPEKKMMMARKDMMMAEKKKRGKKRK